MIPASTRNALLLSDIYPIDSNCIHKEFFGTTYDHAIKFIEKINENTQKERKELEFMNSTWYIVIVILLTITIIGIIAVCIMEYYSQKKRGNIREQVKKKVQDILAEYVNAFTDVGIIVDINDLHLPKRVDVTQILFSKGPQLGGNQPPGSQAMDEALIIIKRSEFKRAEEGTQGN